MESSRRRIDIAILEQPSEAFLLSAWQITQLATIVSIPPGRYDVPTLVCEHETHRLGHPLLIEISHLLLRLHFVPAGFCAFETHTPFGHK